MKQIIVKIGDIDTVIGEEEVIAIKMLQEAFSQDSLLGLLKIQNLLIDQETEQQEAKYFLSQIVDVYEVLSVKKQ